MNHSEYVFLKAFGKQDQYPIDYTEQLFFSEDYLPQSPTQIVVYRQDDLVFYNYYRKIKSTKKTEISFVGLSVSFNGVYYSKIDKVFDIFENLISDMALSGDILELSDEGQIVAKPQLLNDTDCEIDEITTSLSNLIEGLSPSDFASLPPQNYGSGPNKLLVYDLKDSDSKLASALSKSNKVLFLKSAAYNTKQLTQCSSKIASLNERNIRLNEQTHSLSQKVRKLTGKKKQYLPLTILAIVLGLSLFCLFLSRTTIRGLKSIINDNHTEISKQAYFSDSLKTIIAHSNMRIASIEKQLSDSTEQLNKYRNFSKEPIIVTKIEIKNEDQSFGDTIYSSSTTYIYPRFDVFSSVDGKTEFSIKFFSPDGLRRVGDNNSDYSYSFFATLTKNSTTTVNGTGIGGDDKGHLKSGSYKIEVWYKDLCLAVKDFIIK